MSGLMRHFGDDDVLGTLYNLVDEDKDVAAAGDALDAVIAPADPDEVRGWLTVTSIRAAFKAVLALSGHRERGDGTAESPSGISSLLSDCLGRVKGDDDVRGAVDRLVASARAGTDVEDLLERHRQAVVRAVMRGFARIFSSIAAQPM